MNNTSAANDLENNIRIDHTMLRVTNLDNSLDFYTKKLGMKVFSRRDYNEGRFTLAFLGYGNPNKSPVIELTHNWDSTLYEHGTYFGHIALKVPDIYSLCDKLINQGVNVLRPPGDMMYLADSEEKSEVIAFIADPDGNKIELIQSMVN